MVRLRPAEEEAEEYGEVMEFGTVASEDAGVCGDCSGEIDRVPIVTPADFVMPELLSVEVGVLLVVLL